MALSRGPLGGASELELGLLPPFPMFHPAFFEELFHFRRRGVVPALGATRSRLALDVALRLSGAGLAPGELDDDLKQGIEHLLEHQVPFSGSPEVGGLSLRQLADKAQYIVLVPLGAGVTATVSALYKGEWTVALLTAATSGGVTVIFAGSLWVADKLFAGVKHLAGGSRSPALPAPPKPERKRSK